MTDSSSRRLPFRRDCIGTVVSVQQREDFVTNEILAEDIRLIIAIAAVTAAVVGLEHVTLGRLWAGNELARRVLGHATIITIIAIPAMAGLLDFTTWLAVAVATAVAGAIVGALEVTEKERRRSAYVRELRQFAETLDRSSEGQSGDGADRK